MKNKQGSSLLGDRGGLILKELLGEPNECFKALCPFKQVNATVTARFLSVHVAQWQLLNV